MTRVFALALHLPEDSFDQYAKRPEAGMRILHYPQQDSSPDQQAGLGAHTDFECWTIVSQDSCGGLEVLNKAGTWIKAKPVRRVLFPTLNYEHTDINARLRFPALSLSISATASCGRPTTSSCRQCIAS